MEWSDWRKQGEGGNGKLCRGGSFRSQITMEKDCGKQVREREGNEGE